MSTSLMPPLPPTFNSLSPAAGPNDLCQMADVIDWLPSLGQQGAKAVNSPWATNRIPRLIRACSAGILSFLRRDTLNPVAINEIRNGSGSNRMALRNWPVISVQAVIAGNVVVPPSPPWSLLGIQYGWVCDGYTVAVANGYGNGPVGGTVGGAGNVAYGAPGGLAGFCPYGFPRGFQNVQIAYTYGFGCQYAITGVSLSNPSGTIPWNGTTVTLTLQIVTPPSSTNPLFIPQTGQTVTISGVVPDAYNGQVVILNVNGNTISYAIPATAPDPGVYESGGSVLAGMIPDDIQQACIELVAQKCARSQHIDQDTLSYGQGQTTSYQRVAIPRETQFALERYKLMPVLEI